MINEKAKNDKSRRRRSKSWSIPKEIKEDVFYTNKALTNPLSDFSSDYRTSPYSNPPSIASSEVIGRSIPHIDISQTRSGVKIDDDRSESEKKFERINMWNCLDNHMIDRRFIQYAIQVIISIIILLFCMVMIILADDAAGETVFISILSGIVSYYIPSPQMPK